MSDNPADSLRRELEAASRHHVFECQCITGEWHTAAAKATFDWLSALIAPIVEAARADGEKLGRNNAARDIEAHRAKWAPMDGNMDQRRLSRHLGIAARVAQGPIDIEDVRVAFERAVSDGN